jgi:flagellar basal-body rod modification protein FlgD
MAITDIAALPPTSSSSTPAPKQELDKQAFMKLLVTQLKAQDPMSPTSNQEFIGQLANFSTLEQMTNLNDNVLGLALLQQDSGMLLAMSNGSALIGKEVSYEDPSTGQMQNGVVSSMLIENGEALLKIGSQKIPLGSIHEIKAAADASSAAGDDSGAENDGASSANADEGGAA